MPAVQAKHEVMVHQPKTMKLLAAEEWTGAAEKLAAGGGRRNAQRVQGKPGSAGNVIGLVSPVSIPLRPQNKPQPAP